MDEVFSLPVTYKGQELEFPFRIVAGGYAQRYMVLIGETEVVYERDDSGDLRAITTHPDGKLTGLPEKDLLEAISAVIEELTR